jgi:anti-sigma-K factor RskA
VSHLDDETLALLALGEHDAAPGAEAHLASCAQCRDALAAYGAVVDAGRRVETADFPTAPRPHVWDRVVAELHEPAAPTSVPPEQPAAVVPLDERRDVRRAPVRRLAPVAAAAAVGLLVGVGATWALTRDSTPTPPAARTAQVTVAALRPVDDPTASGRAVLRVLSPTKRTVAVTVTGLPMPAGTFYEVWLMDPSDAHLVALGVLDSAGNGVYAVPPGLDLSAYSAVDVSLQPMNGSPLHSQNSAVRGSITG